MSKNNTFFVHINRHMNTPSVKGVPRKKLHKPSYTIAGVLQDGSLHIGISQCSPRDQFVKKLGRVRAEGRAKSSDAIKIIVPPDVIMENTIGKFFSQTCKTLIK